MRKTRIGIVVGDKMDKTVVVAVENYTKHSLYKKIIRRTKKYKAMMKEMNVELGIKSGLRKLALK